MNIEIIKVISNKKEAQIGIGCTAKREEILFGVYKKEETNC